jgi:hypothetical protein
MPPTSEVTDDPVTPEPVTVTDTRGVVVEPLKVAVVAVAAFIVTLQVPTPVQPPPVQPANACVAVGVAVKTTVSPCGNAPTQLVGLGFGVQVNPAGLELTVPVPLFVPDARVTDSSTVGGGGADVPMFSPL